MSDHFLRYLNYFRIGKLTWVLDVVAQICSDSSVNLYQTPRSDNSEHITLHSQSYFHHTRHRETSTDERVMACIIIFNYKAYHFQWFCTSDRGKGMCGNKMPTRCNRGFYCRSYCLLNTFQAPLCPSSGVQDYYRVVAACGIWCCGFNKCGAEGYVSGLQDAANRTHNLKITARNTTGSNHCIMLLSFWWWA